MKKVYLIQVKSFVTINNYEYQVADCGTVPEIYSSKRKAENRFSQILEENGKTWINVNQFPYTNFEYKTPWGARRVVTLQETTVE